MPRDIAARLGRALNVRSQTAIHQIDRALSDYARLVPQAGATPIEGEISTAQVTSGTFADARIAESNVTQHEAALSIDAGLQLTSTLADARVAESNVTQHEGAIDHDALTNFAPAEHVDWSVTGAEDVHVDRISEAAVTQHEGALAITEIQITDLGNYAEKGVDETITGTWTFDRSASDTNFIRGGGSDAENFAVIFGNSYDFSLAPVIRGYGSTAASTPGHLLFSVPAGGRLSFQSVGAGAHATFASTILGNYADDAAAAIGGVPVTGIYRNGNVLQIRVS